MSQTVFAAISPLFRKPVIHFGKSTNQQDFCIFLRQIKASLPFSHTKPILIYDGASAHTARQSQLLIDSYFEGARMPPFSSEFNS